MKKRIAIIVMMALAVFSLPVLAIAQEGSPAGPPAAQERIQPPPFWQDARMAEELQLTEEQIASLEELAAAFHESNREMIQQVHQAQAELDEAMADSLVNEQAVVRLARQIAKIQGRLFVRSVKHHVDVGRLLTEEQRITLQTFAPRPGPQGPPPAER